MRFARIVLFATVLASSAFARVRFPEICQLSNVKPVTNTLPAAQGFQNTLPGATVTVYVTGGAAGTVSTAGTAVTWQAGTLFNPNGQWNGLSVTINAVAYSITSCASTTACTLGSSAGTQNGVAYSIALAPAAIYSDNAGTPLANPFTCALAAAAIPGFIGPYADNGTYDFRFSGTGVTTPFTIGAQSGVDPFSVPNQFVYNPALGSWASQCTAAQTAGASIVLTSTVAVTTSFNYGCQIVFLNGGKFQPASGQNAGFIVQSAPLTAICDISLSGNCLITSTDGNDHPEWRGAKRDGSTNDQAAIQSTIAGAVSTGMTVQMHAGVYAVATTGLTWPNSIVCNPQSGTAVCGLRMIGAGHTQTFISTVTASIDLLCASTPGAAGAPFFDVEGMTLIGPDASSPGGSGNGLCVHSTAINTPDVTIKDVYARNFFGSGKAGIWLDSIQGGFTLEHDRVDLSDYGFRFSNTGAFAGTAIGVGNNLQVSQIHARGYSFEAGALASTFNDITSQGGVCTGLYLTKTTGVVFNGIYLEGNNSSAAGSGCYGADLETGTRGNTFNGFYRSTSADNIFLNGTAGGANPVTGNTFISGSASNGGVGGVVINNVNSIGNTWINWQAASGGASGTDFSGAGNNGSELGTFLNCGLFDLPNTTTTVAGNEPCNLYRTHNTTPTTIANMTATALVGAVIKLVIFDPAGSVTTIGTGGNLNVDASACSAKNGAVYTFVSLPGAVWNMGPC